jgi:naphthoate synthase
MALVVPRDAAAFADGACCLNADCGGQMGLLDLTGNATLLSSMSDEAPEAKKALGEKRKPDFSKFPRYP